MWLSGWRLCEFTHIFSCSVFPLAGNMRKAKKRERKERKKERIWGGKGRETKSEIVLLLRRKIYKTFTLLQ